MHLPSTRQSLLDQLESAGYQPIDHRIIKRANNQIALKANRAQKVQQLLKELENLEDVQNVYSNLKGA